MPSHNLFSSARKFVFTFSNKISFTNISVVFGIHILIHLSYIRVIVKNRLASVQMWVFFHVILDTVPIVVIVITGIVAVAGLALIAVFSKKRYVAN